MTEADCIVNTRDSLGESPLWDPVTERLFWVDINRCLIHQLDPRTGEITDWPCKTEPGCLGRADNGRLVAGLRDGFYFFSPATGKFEGITDPEPGKPENRVNDGKVDRAGRFWAGTMRDPNPDEPCGALYKLEGQTALQMLDGIRIPNSLCWSPDNQTLYFSDTRARVIWGFDFNLASGELTNRRLFVDLQGQLGRPDGATVDTEGYLWSAEYGGGRVVRYTPDGTVDKVVNLPVANVTCPTFGGTDYKTLFITTASQRLTENELAEQPLAGGLFSLKVTVAGLPEPVFGC
jgi:sugar lactone lactonase YvrE|tara:strand:+ start:924 stop:1796 length:873 start_codon:yes stop_codon:yes gene_type:complete